MENSKQSETFGTKKSSLLNVHFPVGGAVLLPDLKNSQSFKARHLALSGHE